MYKCLAQRWRYVVSCKIADYYLNRFSSNRNLTFVKRSYVLPMLTSAKWFFLLPASPVTLLQGTVIFQNVLMNNGVPLGGILPPLGSLPGGFPAMPPPPPFFPYFPPTPQWSPFPTNHPSFWSAPIANKIGKV